MQAPCILDNPQEHLSPLIETIRATLEHFDNDMRNYAQANEDQHRLRQLDQAYVHLKTGIAELETLIR